LLIPGLAYCLTLKMEAVCSSETVIGLSPDYPALYSSPLHSHWSENVRAVSLSNRYSSSMWRVS
jgi:hypothetical protein